MSWGIIHQKLGTIFIDNGDYDRKTFEVKARPVTKIEGLRPGMSLIIK